MGLMAAAKTQREREIDFLEKSIKNSTIIYVLKGGHLAGPSLWLEET